MIRSTPSVLLQSDLFAQVTCRDLKIEDIVQQNRAKCGVCFNSTFSPFSQYLVSSRRMERKEIPLMQPSEDIASCVTLIPHVQNLQSVILLQ